jgi:hypothetical protein
MLRISDDFFLFFFIIGRFENFLISRGGGTEVDRAAAAGADGEVLMEIDSAFSNSRQDF